MDKVNLAEKLGLFDEYWSPKIVGELNGQYVKLAKLKGEFVWHDHEAEDELFLALFNLKEGESFHNINFTDLNTPVIGGIQQ